MGFLPAGKSESRAPRADAKEEKAIRDVRAILGAADFSGEEIAEIVRRLRKKFRERRAGNPA